MMRAMTLALLLTSVPIFYFAMRRSTTIGDLPHLTLIVSVIGIAGIFILFAGIYSRANRRL